jgi:hypothetical protein
MGFDGILGWNAVEDFEDTRSGIWQAADGVHLLGRVHSVVDFGDGRTMVEVYLRNSLEFFTVDLEMMEEKMFESNSGLEVTVGKLYLYPTTEESRE